MATSMIPTRLRSVRGYGGSVSAEAPRAKAEKWQPVSRLREARFGGRRKVGRDHARTRFKG